MARTIFDDLFGPKETLMPATVKNPAPKRKAPVLSFPKGRKVEVFHTGETLIVHRKGNRKRLAEAWAKVRPVKISGSIDGLLRADRDRAL